jgi:hypothetical protein
MDGVLFIDEAYDLDPNGDFKGKPIVSELLVRTGTIVFCEPLNAHAGKVECFINKTKNTHFIYNSAS